jgi:hypothetical protein
MEQACLFWLQRGHVCVLTCSMLTCLSLHLISISVDCESIYSLIYESLALRTEHTPP